MQALLRYLRLAASYDHFAAQQLPQTFKLTRADIKPQRDVFAQHPHNCAITDLAIRQTHGEKLRIIELCPKPFRSVLKRQLIHFFCLHGKFPLLCRFPQNRPAPVIRAAAERA